MKRTMNRRQLVASLISPLARPRSSGGDRGALAQTPAGPPKRIGLMMAIAENDPEGLRRVEAFRVSLADAGWTDRRNVAIDVSWYGGSFQLARQPPRRMRTARWTSLSSTARPAWTPCARRHQPPRGVRGGQQSGRRGLCAEPVAARRQLTGFSTFEPESRQVAATAAAGGARPQERQHDARSEVHRVQRAVACDRKHSPPAGRRPQFGVCQQPGGDRACACGDRQTPGSGPDRQSKPNQHGQSENVSSRLPNRDAHCR